MNKEYEQILHKRGFKVIECLCVIYDEDSTFYITNEEELKQFVNDQKENIEEVEE